MTDKKIPKIVNEALPEEGSASGPAAIEPSIKDLFKKQIEMQSSEAVIGPKIKAAVSKSIDQIVSQYFHSYAEGGKMIEKALKDALKVDDLNIPSLGGVFTAMVKSKVDQIVSEQIAGRLAEDIESIMKIAPKKIKMSEICEGMLGRYSEGKDEWEIAREEPIITCSHKEISNTFWAVYLDEDEHHREGDAHQSNVRFYINPQEGKILSGSVDRRYTGKNSTLLAPRDFGLPRGLDQLIRSYYACGTIIELDFDYCDLSIPYD